jgi:hypothetical protein
VCVAFANGPVTNHPGHTELIWHVWENDARAFSQDSDVVAMEAPECITFVGRKQASANSYVNGKYSLQSCIHGKPAYQHDLTGIIIRFDAEERRWLLTNSQTADNICIAWAADENLSHPGDPLLQWHFWEPEKNTFIADLSVGFVISPDVVHIVGGGSQAERIQGAYHLVGIHECRPLYSKPGTQVVIRYSQGSQIELANPVGSALLVPRRSPMQVTCLHITLIIVLLPSHRNCCILQILVLLRTSNHVERDVEK